MARDPWACKEPWSCEGCQKAQEEKESRYGPYLDTSGWYWVLLAGAKKPVYFCIGCFQAKDGERDDYDGTYANSLWKPGEYEVDGRKRFIWVETPV